MNPLIKRSIRRRQRKSGTRRQAHSHSQTSSCPESEEQLRQLLMLSRGYHVPLTMMFDATGVPRPHSELCEALNEYGLTVLEMIPKDDFAKKLSKGDVVKRYHSHPGEKLAIQNLCASMMVTQAPSHGIHFVRLDGTLRDSMAEVKEALAIYPDEKGKMTEKLKALLPKTLYFLLGGIAILSAGLLYKKYQQYAEKPQQKTNTKNQPDGVPIIDNQPDPVTKKVNDVETSSQLILDFIQKYEDIGKEVKAEEIEREARTKKLLEDLEARHEDEMFQIKELEKREKRLKSFYLFKRIAKGEFSALVEPYIFIFKKIATARRNAGPGWRQIGQDLNET